MFIRFDQWLHSGDPTPSDVIGALIMLTAFVVLATFCR